jgi:para-nitrobenzyl esterase
MQCVRALKLSVTALLAFAGIAATQPDANDPTLIKIDSGTVRGTTAGGVVSFKGIPYAAPPIGELRWRMPQPLKPWQGILSADKFGPASMQADDVPKSEDCLTLNVWRPTGSTGPLPVMV